MEPKPIVELHTFKARPADEQLRHADISCNNNLPSVPFELSSTPLEAYIPASRSFFPTQFYKQTISNEILHECQRRE